MRASGWVVSVVLLGCGDDGATVTSDAPAPVVDAMIDAAVPTRTITGTYAQRHLINAVAQPVDLSGATVAAHSLPSFAKLAGTGTTSGTFTIPNVPVGRYFLQVGNTYIERADDTIDLTYEALGRSTAQHATAATNLSLTLGNLAAWQANDMIEVVSMEAGLVGLRVATEASASPTVGATSLSGLTWDIRNADTPALVSTTAGDTLIVTQLGTFNALADPYRTIVRSYQPSTVTMTNGNTTPLSGTFSTVNLTNSLNLAWNRQAFNTAIRTTSTADESMVYSLLALHALPSAATNGLYGDSADIMVYAPGYSDAVNTFSTASWSIGDPFPSSWTRCVTARLITYRYMTPPNSQPFPVYGQIAIETVLPAAGTSIAPALGPVRAPMVAGMPAMNENLTTPITTQPTIEWQTPAFGTPHFYQVGIVHVAIVPGQPPNRTLTASFITTSTRLTIPPGLLTAGEIYYFMLQTESVAGWSEATPALLKLPTAFTSITTAMFRS